MRDVSEILREIRVAAEHGDNQAVPGLVLELGPNVLVFTELPDEILNELKGLVASDRFRALDESWRLVYFIDDNWNLLTDRHRESLRPVLADAFDKFRNYMGAFVIGEMLGRRFCDEDAFRLLDRLSGKAALPARALAPHGLETLARNTKDARLRGLATRRLRDLTESGDPAVRKEATIALGKATASKK
jgi:hypothetical protein